MAEDGNETAATWQTGPERNKKIARVAATEIREVFDREKWCSGMQMEEKIWIWMAVTCQA